MNRDCSGRKLLRASVIGGYTGCTAGVRSNRLGKCRGSCKTPAALCQSSLRSTPWNIWKKRWIARVERGDRKLASIG